MKRVGSCPKQHCATGSLVSNSFLSSFNSAVSSWRCRAVPCCVSMLQEEARARAEAAAKAKEEQRRKQEEARAAAAEAARRKQVCPQICFAPCSLPACSRTIALLMTSLWCGISSGLRWFCWFAWFCGGPYVFWLQLLLCASCTAHPTLPVHDLQVG